MNLSNLTLPDLGWGHFFQSQLGLAEIGAAVPVRITEVQRGRAVVLGWDGVSSISSDKLEPLAVGDWLLLGEGPPRLLVRQSTISRKAAGTAHAVQLIATNVTTMFIVSSCNAEFNIGRLERYLVLARQCGVAPVMILTKADLGDEPQDYVDRARTLDGTLVVEALDARSQDAAERLAPWCGRGETVVLVGSSGVGKSTLANLLAGAEQHVQGIREDGARGRHTTTARSMHRLLGGGWLIDTPGIRELQLNDVAEGIEAVFGDILELATTCHFRDCEHEAELGCAVRAAVLDGSLTVRRLDSWRKLQREDRWNSQTLAEGRAASRRFGKMHRVGKERMKVGKGRLPPV